MASMQNVKRILEDLNEELQEDCGNSPSVWFEDDKEEPREVGEVVKIMAAVTGLLASNIANFHREWDYAEDCRRGRLAEAGA